MMSGHVTINHVRVGRKFSARPTLGQHCSALRRYTRSSCQRKKSESCSTPDTLRRTALVWVFLFTNFVPRPPTPQNGRLAAVGVALLSGRRHRDLLLWRNIPFPFSWRRNRRRKGHSFISATKGHLQLFNPLSRTRWKGRLSHHGAILKTWLAGHPTWPLIFVALHSIGVRR